MKLKFSAEYDDIAAEWQFQVIALLKEKLLKCGVENHLTKQIVEEFIFDLAMLHDQEEIKVRGKSYSPMICFSDFSDHLIANEEESNLHEFVFENIRKVFEK
jgi:hypothetical protein